MKTSINPATPLECAMEAVVNSVGPKDALVLAFSFKDKDGKVVTGGQVIKRADLLTLPTRELRRLLGKSMTGVASQINEKRGVK